jgi:hypothetical protein
MKQFSQQQILESLKNDELYFSITGGLVIENLDDIKDLVINNERKILAEKIKSKLITSAIEKLETQNVFEINGDLSDIGHAHIVSMLMNFGKISKEEIQQIAKQKNSSNENDIQETYAIIALSLSKIDFETVENSFNNRYEKNLIYFILKELNRDGIKRAIELEIISTQNTLTERGWDVIKWFVEKTKNNLKEESEKNPISEKPKSKKWFEFWK